MKFVIPVIALLCGTTATAIAATPSPEEIEKANEFFEEVFNERVARSPEFQARLGIKDDYDEWDDISPAFEAETLEIAKRRLAELRETIDYERLDRQTQLSYDLFVDETEKQIEGYAYRLHDYPVNQMFGAQSRVPAFLINYHRVDSEADARAYVARLRRVAPLFDQLVANLEARAEHGVVPPRFVFGHVLGDCRNVLTGRPFDDGDEDSTLLADFRKKVEELDVPATVKAELLREAEEALLRSVKPAYEKLIAYVSALEETATTDDGVWKLPDGGAFYDYRLRFITTTDMSADEIHEVGLSEVARIHDEMRAIKNEVGHEGTLQEFFRFMREDEQFYYDDTAEGRTAYLEHATEIIDRMRERLDDLFTVKPKAKMVVKAVEPFREKSAGKAFYQRPSPDGSRPGVYYANLYRMADMPKYQMEALAYHEGIPGHHMQLTIAMELEGIPKFRRYARYTAYTEGWGLYSEFVPKEIGFYEDPYSDFGRLAMELWRACRLVVDTGIHHKKWTREKAIAYLMENTPNPEGDAVKAIERYIVMPGQATGYKIGMLKILELRAQARAELGERFDIREFHDLLLENGPVPLSTLEQLVVEWINAQTS